MRRVALAEVVGSKSQPVHFFYSSKIGHYFDIVLGICRTNLAAMPMPYPTVCSTECQTKVEIDGK
jgi:hypothetical protein